MQDAIELAQFYLSEANRLLEAATVSQEIELAETLRRWLLDSWPDIAQSEGRDPATIVPRDIAWKGPNALRVTDTAKKMLAILERHGWLILLDKGHVIDGQARQLAYRIVRGDQ